MSIVYPHSKGDGRVDVPSCDLSWLSDGKKQSWGYDDIRREMLAGCTNPISQYETSQPFEGKDMKHPIFDEIFHLIYLYS